MSTNTVPYFIKAVNNSSVITILTVQFNSNGNRHTFIKTFDPTFTVTVPLPVNSTDIHVELKPSSGRLKIAYPTFYEKNLATPMNLELVFFGKLLSQIVWENGQKFDPNAEYHIKLFKYPNKPKAAIGEEIVFSIYMMNYSNSIITKLMLSPEVIPVQAKFVANSLKINNQTIPSNIFPTTPITLPNLMYIGKPLIIRYKLKFASLPQVSTNTMKTYTFAKQPAVSYSYTDSNNIVKKVTLIGNIEGVTIYS